MNAQTNNIRLTQIQRLGIFSISIIVLLFSMHYRQGIELADDGAFFLRYAQNMANGAFWVWNIGDPPIWGASAPFYPLLVALPISIGVSPVVSIVCVGLILAAVSLATITVLLTERFGIVTGFAFIVFAALDSNLNYFGTAGLETPLTIGLLT